MSGMYAGSRAGSRAGIGISAMWILVPCLLLLPHSALTHFYHSSQPAGRFDKNYQTRDHVLRKASRAEKGTIIDPRLGKGEPNYLKGSVMLSHPDSYATQGVVSSDENELMSESQNRGPRKQDIGSLFHLDASQKLDLSDVPSEDKQHGKHWNHHQKYRRHSEKLKSGTKKLYDGRYDNKASGDHKRGKVIPQDNPEAYNPQHYDTHRNVDRNSKQYETDMNGAEGYDEYQQVLYRKRRYDEPMYLYRTAMQFPQPRIGVAFRQTEDRDKLPQDYYMGDDPNMNFDEESVDFEEKNDKEGENGENTDPLDELVKKKQGNQKNVESSLREESHDEKDFDDTLISPLDVGDLVQEQEKTSEILPETNIEKMTPERMNLNKDGEEVEWKVPDKQLERAVLENNASDIYNQNITTESRLSYRSPMYVDFRSTLPKPSVEPENVDPMQEPETLSEPESIPEPEQEKRAPDVEPDEGDNEPEEESADSEYLDEKSDPENNERDTKPEPPIPETEEILEPGVEEEFLPEGGAESESEGEPESTGESEPEAEGEEIPEPESEPSQQPERTPPGVGEIDDSDAEEEMDIIYDNPVYAEPEPNWETAKRIWGPAWEVHIYGIGIAFAVLAGYSCFSLVRLWKEKNLLSQGYFVSLNIIMLFMGFFRATYFLIDGYNSNGTFHPVGAYFLLSIGFPCITSAFSILFLALLQSTKMQIMSPKIQSTRFLVAVITFHFALSIITDIVVGYFYSAEAMLFVCQAATVFWGLLLFGGYIYIFRKLYMAAMWRQKEMMRQMLAQIKLDGISPITKTPKLTLNIAIRVTLMTSMLGLIMAALMIYGMAGVYSIFSQSIPDPWPWWGFKFGLRLIELGMSGTMSYVATQPFRYNQTTSEKKWRWSGLFYLAPCRRLCECDEHDLQDDGLDWESLPGDNLHHIDNRNHNHVNQVLCNPEESMPMTEQILHLPVRDGSTNSRKQGASRPASLLVNDNGFVRFRETGEIGGEVLISTDDELDNFESSPHDNPFVAELEKNGLINTNMNDFYYADKLPDKFYDPLIDPKTPDYFMRSVPLARRLASRNVPLDTGENTPATPRSYYSARSEFDCTSMWSFRPPSSIHLRDSIENALDLDLPGFNLRTPDCLDSPLNTPANRMLLYRLRDRFSRHKSMSSMSDLQSLRDYKNRHYLNSRSSFDMSSTGYCTPDEMDPELESSESTLKSTRSQLFRSYSDSIGSIFHDPYTYMVNHQKEGFRGREKDTRYESSIQMQDVLRDINAMCSAIGEFAVDNSADVTPV